MNFVNPLPALCQRDRGTNFVVRAKAILVPLADAFLHLQKIGILCISINGANFSFRLFDFIH